MNPAFATLDAAEIDKFSRIAGRWWDETGPFAPLHRLNPVRLAYIRERAQAHFGVDTKSLKPFSGLSVLDVGCGGGLVCEPMVRLGAAVTGIDADAHAQQVSRMHAAESGLAIDYRTITSDTLAEGNQRFDIVLALEIIEHVADIEVFAASLRQLVAPGGMLIVSTLNRTPQAFLNAIIGAEYLLRWLPRGTHDWKKFLKPSELTRLFARHGFIVDDIRGLAYDTLKRSFSLSRETMHTNYFCTFSPTE